MRHLLKLGSLALLALSFGFSTLDAQAMVHDPHAHPERAGAPQRQKTVKSGPWTATFHFNPTANARFTCPMHPTVTADRPGKDPSADCGMDLVKQTHTIDVAIVDARQVALGEASIRLRLQDEQGMTQVLPLTGKRGAQGSLALEKGVYAVTAIVQREPHGKLLAFATTYEVK